MLNKLIAAGDARKSRFHTEDNKFIGWSKVFIETPIVAAQKLRNTVSGTRTVAPWWPIAAIEAVESKLRPDMVAVEFGSGGSTIWIARRVRMLLTREHDEHWAAITRQRIIAEGLENCDLQHRRGKAYYSFESDERFDFAVVDGEFRWRCIDALKERMNPGGFIYFDNSDSDKDAGHYCESGLSGSHHAQDVVHSLVKSRRARLEQVHGMIHGELFAGSGMLIYF